MPHLIRHKHAQKNPTQVRRTRGYSMIDALEPRQHLSRSQVVGYLTNYSLTGGKIDLNKIDFTAVTQLNYFATVPSSSGNVTFTTDESNRLDAVIAKAHSYGVKVSLVLGGAGQDSTLLSIIGSAAGGNTTAAAHLADQLNAVQSAHHIDGVDVDWEPLSPTTTQITNYGLLLKTLQDNTTLQLSAAVNPEKLYSVSGAPGGRAYVLDGVGVTALDQIGVMAYDLDYADHSPIPRSESDLQAWAMYVESFGQSREKLLFGVPYYAHGGTSWANSRTQSYRDIINAALAQGGSTAASTNSQNLKFSDSFGNASTTWYYNGKDAISTKTGYAIDSNVGGVMIWDLAQDHFDSGLNYDAYSLLPSIRTTANSRGTLTATGAFKLNDAHQGVTMTFNNAADAASLGPADLVLTNLTTGATINTAGLATVTYDAATNTATWSFNTSRLLDGNYHATLRAGAARDATGGALTSDAVADFFVLGGDANRDRTVNFDDLVALAQNYSGTGKTYAQGDFDGNGTVNFDDLIILAQNYNKALTAPALNAPLAVTSTFSNVPISKSKPRGPVVNDIIA